MEQSEEFIHVLLAGSLSAIYAGGYSEASAGLASASLLVNAGSTDEAFNPKVGE
jgi:predicted Co/Zn/Cd cation transporter (cation efflux family)